MFALIWPGLESMSPVATLIASLFTVAAAAGLYALFRWWRGRTEKRSNAVESLIAFLRRSDRALVRTGSRWVGTRVVQPWPRRAVALGIFIFVAVFGALLPWPWCLWALSFGLLNVFIIFRHWSHDEAEAKSQVSPEDKQIRIDGDLSAEMAGACAFVLVYATTAFAQIQAARQGFQMPPDAGAFTFIRYALVEGLKVAFLVPYSDLFAGELRNLGGAAATSFSAKSAVLVFRALLGLIILVGLKRFIDFARRTAESYDLQPILAVLNNPDADQAAVKQAVGNLTAFATRGHRTVAERLEQIVTEMLEGKPRYAASVRFAAANGLVSYAEPRTESGTLLVAIESYRKLAHEDWPRERAPVDWFATQHALGVALRTLGERETGTARLEEAVAALREALKEGTRERTPREWAATQNDLGRALCRLGEREGGTTRFEEAIAACREALQERTRARMPLAWAATQSNLGNALRTLGERENGTAHLEEAIVTYGEVLKEYTRKRAPLAWAATQNNLGAVLQALGEREHDTARLDQAIAAYREALEERTSESTPLDWATTQNNLGTALQTLGEHEGDMALLEEAVAAYRQALQERTRARAPLDWAVTQNNLGNALCALGERESGTARFEEAVVAFRESLKERTREKMPLDWAMTQNNLGNALRALGERESGTAHFEEAVAAFSEAARELTQEKTPHHHDIVRQNLALILSALERRKNQPFGALASRRV